MAIFSADKNKATSARKIQNDYHAIVEILFIMQLITSNTGAEWWLQTSDLKSSNFISINVVFAIKRLVNILVTCMSI